MSQKRMTEFFSNRKRGGENPSKKQKLAETDPTLVLPQSGTASAPVSQRRTRGKARAAPASSHRRPEEETPQKGYDFEPFRGPDTPEVSTEVSSAKKRLILKPSPKRPRIKSDSRPVFAFSASPPSKTSGADEGATFKVNEVESLRCEVKAMKNAENLPLEVVEKCGSESIGKELVELVCVFGGRKKASAKAKVTKKFVTKNAVAKESVTEKLCNESVAKQPEGASAGQEPNNVTVGGIPSKESDKIITSKMAPLSAAELKARLHNCGDLTELKRRLQQFEQNKRQVDDKAATQRQRTVAQAGKEADTQADEEADVLSDKHTDVGATLARGAYVRHSVLAAPIPPSLTLPRSYQALRELFTSADTAVSMLHKRAEVCTLEKLQHAVQTMTKRAFETSHLGQIRTVYPSAYTYRQERNLHRAGARTSEYQLTIEANLPSPSSPPATVASPGDEAGGLAPAGNKMSFTIGKLLERRTTFYSSLIDIVKGFHREFLASLKMADSCLRDDQILRWHPRFDVDAVPDVVPSELPSVPDEGKVLRTAGAVLEAAKRNRTELNPVLQRALERVASAKLAAAAESPTSTGRPSPGVIPVAPTAPSNGLPPAPAIKGIPQTLLEKVRAREARKAEDAMMRSTADDHRLAMLQRLPEMMRILRGQFVTKKKPALLMQVCCQCVCDSTKSPLNPVDTEAHLRLIAELVPDLVSIVHISSGVYVRLDTRASLAGATDRILQLQKQ